jgi:Tol biopolymer transport system component
VRLLDGADGVLSRPEWSPDGGLIVYSVAQASAVTRLRGVTPDGQPFPVPEIETAFFSSPYGFVPNTSSLVFLRGVGAVGGWARRMDFWLLDVRTGDVRRLTDLDPQFEIKSFDISPDGKQILFERYRENSDIVLIDLPPRS